MNAFPASWDSQSRKEFPAIAAHVFDNHGHMGVGSGDAMYGFDDYWHSFIDQNPLDDLNETSLKETEGEKSAFW